MQKVSRQQIFAQAAKKLRQDFDELSTVPHAGLKGHEAENIVRQFLRGHLPQRFDVGSGFVIDPRDNISRQTDLIVYDAINCPVYRASEDAAIIPSDNVAAVIEVKSRLDKQAMEDAFQNVAAVKGLSKTKQADIPLPVPVTTQTFCGLFAFSTPLTMETILDHYTDCVRRHGIGRHVDVVLVLDKGIISLVANTQATGWAHLILEGMGGDAAEGAHIGASLIPLTSDSLDFFLRLLLSQLKFFRGMIGHPGFKWADAPDQIRVSYLTSVTNEKDPGLREQKLQQYAEQIRAEFEQSPAPSASEPRKESRADPPSVIHLPAPDDLKSS